MRGNTALAPFSTGHNMFDVATYERIKRYLDKKDQDIAKVLQDEIGDSLARCSSNGTMLDVGSFDGSLLKRIISSLDACSLKAVTCVEPEPQAMLHLKHALNERRCSFFLGSLEDFRNASNDQYSVVTGVHLLYHQPTTAWPALIRDLRTRVQPGGSLFLQIVSRTSMIYRQFTTAELPPDPQVEKAYGYYSFAEDLEPILSSMELTYRKRVIETELVIQHSPRCTDGFRELAELFAFMRRCRIPKARKRLLQHSQMSPLPQTLHSTDYLYIIPAEQKK